ncbi:MAG: hypothetical protein NTZ48_02490 [Candidatus Omnitrophica bacterium]|nr:hypothetical protein [Candidatus Omnitrophota bacterium]
MKVKAIAMFSGGLDSILASKLMLEQGIDLEAVHFDIGFYSYKSGASPNPRVSAEELGIPLKVLDVSEDFLEVLKAPRHGYGSNLNPCIDCRIFTLNKTKKLMEETGAKFIVTGEVLGERPMSQKRNTLELIDRNSELEGLILRPLSARLLEPTMPEKEGWVKREGLLDIEGRSRKPQLRLAAEFGIKKYPAPAGGCLLTDPIFSHKLKDLMYYGDLNLDNISLLRLGRYFRLSPGMKVIVGRNEGENKKIMDYAGPGDTVFRVVDSPGPVALARGEGIENFIDQICRNIASYADEVDHGQIKILLKREAPHFLEIRHLSCKGGCCSD